ncbi:MAG: PIN domain-containing protein [Alphaproteobacteria bacterium]|nr:PIN domain-containing protein [Alphaproteobacteria bacterium]
MIIAVDSSVLIDLQQGKKAPYLAMLEDALAADDVMLPPVVLAEILSNPREDQSKNYEYLRNINLLETDEGYWQRAGLLRKKILQKKLKAKLGDALIAQSCIDHAVPLLTRDEDFKHYAKYCGLKLVQY